MKKICFVGEEKFLFGLKELAKTFGYSLDEKGKKYICERTGDKIEIDATRGETHIRYPKDDQFFRAFSLALQCDGQEKKIEVRSLFQRFGTMLNCSNKPLNVGFIKNFIRKSALMGYNYLELYTETTYEIKSEPYFGYKKGRYSQEEFKELVDYGKKFNVELVPCIQTLGHMQELFKWNEYSDVYDIERVMLIDYERTYELIEKMLKSLSECFETNRINLGMDEAYFAGFGRYNWFVDPTKPDLSELFIRHLKRVLCLAEKYGFTKPAIWFDNLFGINYKGYIVPPVWLFKDFSKEIRESFPKVQMIFWNYVLTDESDFSRYVGYIRQLSKDISFASMAHGYTSFAPDNLTTAKLVETAKNGCLKNGIDDIMITWWGQMISPLALTAGLYDYIERCSETCGYDFNERCAFLFGYTYDELRELDLPNYPDDDPSSTGMAEGKNPPFYILANDLLLDPLGKHIPDDAETKYAAFAKRLAYLSEKGGEYGKIFAFESELCKLLSFKSRLVREIRSAYGAKELNRLKTAANTLPELGTMTENFHAVYREYWKTFNKSMGWEIFDHRLGGAILRIKTVKKILEEYLAGDIGKIEELEEPVLPLSKDTAGKTIAMGNWDFASTTGL